MVRCSLPPMHSKDSADYVRGKWIIEMAELSSITKAEVAVVKGFISRREERFRPAYARSEITYPRQCIFAGTTNKAHYLRDETGNRRFWPVKVGFCDAESLKRDRDQLWSEALRLFNAGEIWWLMGDVARVAARQQEQRVAQDAWEAEITIYLEGQVETSCTSVAKEVLGLEMARLDRAVTNRITTILAANGWARSGKFTSGPQKDRARYVRVAIDA